MKAVTGVKYLFAVAAVSASAAVGVLAGAGPVHADPGQVCGTPDVPCAGPGPLTPEQRCAFIAWRTWMPCNWVSNEQVPAGTPGSLG